MPAKISIQTVEKWFTDRGSKLTSPFVNCGTRITFLCSRCGIETSHAKFTKLKKDNPKCICFECHTDLMRIKPEDIKQWFKEQNSELLNEVTGVKDRVIFKCSVCGREASYCNLHQLKIRNPVCKCKACNNKSKHQADLEAWFIEKGSKLLSTYINNNTPVKYLCKKCGGEETRTYSHLLTDSKNTPEIAFVCKKCTRQRLSEKFSTPVEKAREYFSSRGSELIEWQGYTEPVKFRCRKCNKIEEYCNYSQICKNRELWCKACWRDFYTGATNPRYNHELTEEERTSRRAHPGYLAWLKDVYLKHSYSCLISKQNSGIKEAHHLFNWRDYTDFRFCFWNGVLLSENLHKQFHMQFGYGKNTLFQFKEFYSNLTGLEFYPVKNSKLIIDIVEEERVGDLKRTKQSFFEKGINYIPILKTELLNKPDIFDSLINLWGNQKLKRVFARTLKIKELSKEEGRAFFKKNHRQGDVSAEVILGLVTKSNEDILAAMSFSPSRYSLSFQYELLRFCSKTQHIIPGAASKLFTHFIKKYQPSSIISYCDIRFSSLDPQKTVYPQLGFKYSHTTKPNYFYFRDGVLHSRLKFQKHKLPEILETFNPKLSEKENVLANGYKIIKDCGSFVYTYVKKTPASIVY